MRNKNLIGRTEEIALLEEYYAGGTITGDRHCDVGEKDDSERGERERD